MCHLQADKERIKLAFVIEEEDQDLEQVGHLQCEGVKKARLDLMLCSDVTLFSTGTVLSSKLALKAVLVVFSAPSLISISSFLKSHRWSLQCWRKSGLK